MGREARMLAFAGTGAPGETPRDRAPTFEEIEGALNAGFREVAAIRERLQAVPNLGSGAEEHLRGQRRISQIMIALAGPLREYRVLTGRDFAYAPARTDHLRGPRRIRIELIDHPKATATFRVVDSQIQSWFGSGGAASMERLLPLLERIITREPDATEGATQVYRVRLGDLEGTTPAPAETAPRAGEAAPANPLPDMPLDYHRFGADTRLHNLDAFRTSVEAYHRDLARKWPTLSAADRSFGRARLRSLRGELERIERQHRAQDTVQLRAGARAFTTAQVETMQALARRWRLDIAPGAAPAGLERVYREVRNNDGSVTVWRALSPTQWSGTLIDLDGAAHEVASPTRPPEAPVAPEFRPLATRTVAVPPLGSDGNDTGIALTIPGSLLPNKGGKDTSVVYRPRSQTFDLDGVDTAAEAGVAFVPVFGTNLENGRRSVRAVQVLFTRPGLFSLGAERVGVEPKSPSDRASRIPPSND